MREIFIKKQKEKKRGKFLSPSSHLLRSFFCQRKFLSFNLLFILCIGSLFSKDLDYKYIQTKENQKIHLLYAHPEKISFKLVRALDGKTGRESVLSLAKRHKAIAAINGGFFQIGTRFDGLPAGILKIEKNWYALPKQPRGAIGWTKDGKKVLIDRLFANVSIKSGKKRVALDGLNRSVEKGEAILFSPAFYGNTLTYPVKKEITITHKKILSIRKKNSSYIPQRGWVISIDKDHPLFDAFPFEKKTNVAIDIDMQPQSSPAYTDPKEWKEMDYILGAAPHLIHKGEILSDFNKEEIDETPFKKRHARTAIALLADGRWLFVVVDEEGENRGGMRMDELADFLLKHGAIEAINLDGGGSSTLVIKDQLINQPLGDEDEGIGEQKVRRVSDAILFFPRGS